MDKTISQIAMEIGVSKQAVWQKIKKEPLSTKLKDSTKKIGNTLYVNTDGIELIKNSFFKINANNTSIDVNNHKENANKKSTDEIIDILTMQLKIINQQNENLAKNQRRSSPCWMSSSFNSTSRPWWGGGLVVPP